MKLLTVYKLYFKRQKIQNTINESNKLQWRIQTFR